MQTYFFIFEVEPTSASPRAQDIKASLANIFVMAPSHAEAEARARAHLMEYAWVVKSLDTAVEPSLERIAQCDASVIALHQKALREGLASEFVAWPKVEGKDDDPIEIRLLGPPLTISNKKH